MLDFQWTWLLALAPLPLFALILPSAQKREPALKVPFYKSAAELREQQPGRSGGGKFNKLILWLIWLSCLAAAANPQWVGEAERMPSSGRDLLLAVDISGSMKIEDMQYRGNTINRLQATKIVVSDFVQERKSDRLGLILFGTQAYLQTPLTYDRETVNTLLWEAQIGFAGEKTAIGDAIGLAVKRLRQRPDTSRVLILLTDGSNNAGALNPDRAAELAQQNNVKIYTIAFGADEMITQGFFGPRRINPSQDIDEEALRRVARQTGGQYFRARNLEELGAIHEQLNRLEPIELDEATFRPTRSLVHWPLSLAFGLSLLWALGSWWRNRANSSPSLEEV